MKGLWIKDDRWHLDGRPVHAGAIMQLKLRGDEWLDVRIESQQGGKVLMAYMRFGGRSWSCRIDPEFDELRWPSDRRSAGLTLDMGRSRA